MVRTKHVADIEDLYNLGADQVIPEEFETSINLFERILEKYLVPKKDIHSVVAQIREDHYGIFREEKSEINYSLLEDIPNIEISALKIREGSTLINKSLAEMQFRKRFRVTIVAVKRDDEIIENPEPGFELQINDILYVLGKPSQIAKAVELFSQKDD